MMARSTEPGGSPTSVSLHCTGTIWLSCAFWASCFSIWIISGCTSTAKTLPLLLTAVAMRRDR